MKVIEVRDNGRGQYTVIFDEPLVTDYKGGSSNLSLLLASDSNPNNVVRGWSIDTINNPRLGKRIAMSNLPENVKQCISKITGKPVRAAPKRKKQQAKPVRKSRFEGII